jgi:hypothetical protein
MRCGSCGTALPDDARFCDRCGARQGARARTTAGTPPTERWEVCEIGTNVNWSRERFVARVGRREVASVEAVAHFLPVPANLAAVERLAASLIAAGWEPQPAGTRWYSRRFRRRLVEVGPIP